MSGAYLHISVIGVKIDFVFASSIPTFTVVKTYVIHHEGHEDPSFAQKLWRAGMKREEGGKREICPLNTLKDTKKKEGVDVCAEIVNENETLMLDDHSAASHYPSLSSLLK